MLFLLISFICPWILYKLGFQINELNQIDSIAILSWFVASALAIIVTTTKLTKQGEDAIRNNKQYKFLLTERERTPSKIFFEQKQFLINSILVQVLLLVVTIFASHLSSWLENNIKMGCYKLVFDYIWSSFFILSTLSILNITYYSIKHVSDFDMQY